jgi:uridine kinase
MSKNTNQSSPLVKKSRPRETVRVTLCNEGTIWSAPVGTRLEEYFKRATPDLVPTARRNPSKDNRTVIAAIVDGQLRELTIPLQHDVQVEPVLMSDSDGLRIYRRSLSFLLIVAVEELFPGRKITIDHSLPFGGYYCAPVEGDPFTEEELEQIEARMWEIVEADESITRTPVPLEEAFEIFEQQGDEDKVRLLHSRRKDYLIVYELRGVRNYFFGYMVPSTGYLTHWDLTHDGKGFILHYPRRTEPNVLQPITALPKLRQVFLETARWLELLGVEDVGALNEAIKNGRAMELILVSEALHERRIADIAGAIADRQPNVRLVLIAGPSSSGKTTSSKRLAVQLMAHGLKPYTLAMDNYFVDRDKTPRDKKGELDFEHLGAVNLDRFNRDLLALMDGKEVRLPYYNFISGIQEEGDTVQLTSEHILIVEGIHALNPELVREIPPDRLFRLYISCLTQLNIDRHNRIPTTDVRLLRRIVRDARKRGYSALDTLSRWPSVREGERRWIFPFQENADVMFNSALVYELAMLRPLAEPLLLQVEPGSPHHIEAKRLLTFLRWVEPMRKLDLIPDNSLLREFVGRGILDDYIPGKPSPV